MCLAPRDQPDAWADAGEDHRAYGRADRHAAAGGALAIDEGMDTAPSVHDELGEESLLRRPLAEPLGPGTTVLQRSRTDRGHRCAPPRYKVPQVLEQACAESAGRWTWRCRDPPLDAGGWPATWWASWASGTPLNWLNMAGTGARAIAASRTLTAQMFVPNPFGARALAAGCTPRATWCAGWPMAQLQDLGRIDHQVKIRGFRIELGEIGLPPQDLARGAQCGRRGPGRPRPGDKRSWSPI